MAAIFFNDAEPFEQTDNAPSTRRPNEKSGENWSSCFREDVYILQHFKHVYSPGARENNLRGQKFDCN